MSKKQKDQTITIDDTEYKVDDLTQEQVASSESRIRPR